MKWAFAIAAVALTLAGLNGRADDLKLDGTYTIVSGEKNGKPLPDDHFKGSVVKIANGKITGTDKDRKEFFACDFKLDSTQTPVQIKMKSTSPKEADAVGLVKKDPEMITIIYALPGGAVPTEFKTKENQHLFVLKPVANQNPPK